MPLFKWEQRELIISEDSVLDYKINYIKNAKEIIAIIDKKEKP